MYLATLYTHTVNYPGMDADRMRVHQAYDGPSEWLNNLPVVFTVWIANESVRSLCCYITSYLRERGFAASVS